MSETPTTDKFGFPAVPCSRCLGRERMEEYLAVDAGRCFKCNGERVVVVDPAAVAAKARFLEARVQLVTVADLKPGDVVALGGPNTITRWEKVGSVRPAKEEGRLIVQTNKSAGTSAGADYPARIFRPEVDVKDYLEGL